MYVDTVSGFLWAMFFFFFFFPPLFSWMFQHDCLDTCCFECLMCMCFVFLYLHLFSAIGHVSHGKVLLKYAHYFCYYYYYYYYYPYYPYYNYYYYYYLQAVADCPCDLFSKLFDSLLHNVHSCEFITKTRVANVIGHFLTGVTNELLADYIWNVTSWTKLQ